MGDNPAMSLPLELHRFDALMKLTRERYGKPTAAEAQVLRFSASTDASDPIDLKDRRPIRGDFLSWLAADKEAANQIDPLGIRVYNAAIASNLALDYSKISFPLNFHFCTFTQDVFVQYAQLASVSLSHCTIQSIRAEGVTVAGSIYLKSSVVHGEMNLNGAHIGLNLGCFGVRLTGSGDVLHVSNAKIGGDIILLDGFSSAGTIWLLETQVDGELSCSGAQMTKSGTALLLDSSEIGTVFFDKGFSSEGAISLIGTNIRGDLNCHGARQFAELRCDKLQVGKRMVYLDIESPATANLLLFSASIGALHDDEKSWPQKNSLNLEGFVYQQLVSHERATADEIKTDEFGDSLKLDVEKRIEWLRLQPDDYLDNAQPWMQLAKLLEATGDIEGSKHVVYEYHRWRARASVWRPFTFFYDQAVEQPLRVAFPIALFWGIGSLVFWRAHRMGAMKSAAKASKDDGDGRAVTPAAPIPFNPVVYTLENVLPVVKLGQDEAWAPDPKASEGTWLPEWKWLAPVKNWAEKWNLTRWAIRLNYPRLALLRWTLILVGWALALVLGAAIGEQFKR